MENQTSFDSESARAAGIRSGIARTLKNPANLVGLILSDLLYARALLADTLKAGKCKHCNRSGPSNLRDLADLIKQLSDLSEQILNRYRGRPSVESNLERHASPRDYAKAVKNLDELTADLDFTSDGIPTSFLETEQADDSDPE